MACCGAKVIGAAVCSVLGSVLSGIYQLQKCALLLYTSVAIPIFVRRVGIGVGFAVVAGGLAVVNAFASGAVVTLVTAVIAFIGIRLVIRCLR